MKLSELIKQQPARVAVAAASTASAAFLSVALLGQYIFHLHPCELCIAQRVPYIVMVGIGAIAPMLIKTERTMEKIVLVCIALFVIDGGIALYHSGVELGWIKGPSGCTSQDKSGDSLEAMRAAIMNAQLVPCDQPMAYFLGLSMASWNVVAAFGAALVTYLLFIRICRRAA